ncbi:MAG TPA: efflux RND transporter periplasmic adaptor subunit, partial [Reyranella sp.]|nr:efflux RND transporter periplasmic adaptor subunit [Reyranella sp.]
MAINRKLLSRVGAAAVMIGLACAGYIFLQVTHRPRASSIATAEEGVPVIAAVAQAQDVPLIVRGIGTVQAYNMAVIKTRVDGAIVKVSFTEGQDVKAGDPLFQIDPRPFKAALEQAQAAKERNEAQLVSAELDLHRDRTLSKEGYQSRQSFDEQTAVVRALKGSIASDAAAITNARLNLDYADIRAPFDGRTGTRLVDIGNLVQAAQATSLVTITQIKPIFVNFTVPQNVNDQVREKQAAGPLAVIALGDDPKFELARGEVTVIDNQIDPTTGTLRLKASFPNADQRLWPGQFVNVRLVLAERKGVTTVPQRAVMQGPGGYFAYVVKADSTAQR